CPSTGISAVRRPGAKVSARRDFPLSVDKSALWLARLMRLQQVELAALNTLAAFSIATGQFDDAIEMGEQGLAISNERGELWQRGSLLNYLSQANWGRGDRRRAEAQARQGTACKHAVDDRYGLATLLETLAWMAAERGAHQRAAMLLGSAERIREASALCLIDLSRAPHD